MAKCDQCDNKATQKSNAYDWKACDDHVDEMLREDLEDISEEEDEE